LKRFNQSNQFERTSKKEYQEQKVKFIKLLNSIKIFSLNTVNNEIKINEVIIQLRDQRYSHLEFFFIDKEKYFK
jgi:hypothetical protein